MFSRRATIGEEIFFSLAGLSFYSTPNGSSQRPALVCNTVLLNRDSARIPRGLSKRSKDPAHRVCGEGSNVTRVNIPLTLSLSPKGDVETTCIHICDGVTSDNALFTTGGGGRVVIPPEAAKGWDSPRLPSYSNTVIALISNPVVSFMGRSGLVFSSISSLVTQPPPRAL